MPPRRHAGAAGAAQGSGICSSNISTAVSNT